MRNRFVLLVGVAVLGMAGCSSTPDAIAVPTYRGTAGAALKAEIVGIVRDSTGYAVSIKVTNLDVVAVGYAPSCDWEVDALVSGNWTSLATAGDCDLTLLALEPGQSYPNTLRVRTALLPQGTDLRVITDSHTTDPVATQ